MSRDAYSISELKTMVAMLDRGERFPRDRGRARSLAKLRSRSKASKLRLRRQRETVLSAAVRSAERDALNAGTDRQRDRRRRFVRSDPRRAP